MYNIILWFI